MKVRIKTWHELLATEGVFEDQDGDIGCEFGEVWFHKDMKELCGECHKITPRGRCKGWSVEPWMYVVLNNDLTEKVFVGLKNNSPFPNPSYKVKGDSGMDLRAVIDYNIKYTHFGDINVSYDSMTIEANARVLIPTLLNMDIPLGVECQVRSRSGLSFKEGIQVTGGLGTVDAPYKGDVGVVIHNISDDAVIIKHGDRIAQGVFVKVLEAEWRDTDDVGTSDRGEGGFGHTGKQ